MSRWIVAPLLVLAVAAAAWTFLRDSGPAHGLTAPSRAGDADHTAIEVLEEDGEGATRISAEDVAPTASEALPEPAPERPATVAGVLAGQVRVNGGPPHEPLELRISPGTASPRDPLTIDAWGRFRLEGLPADWSGAILLPAPYRVTVDEHNWRDRVEVERLRDDLLLEVERRPALRLQVLREDRSPAGDIPLSLRQQGSSGSMDLGTRTDARGIAMADISHEPLSQVLAEVQLDDGAHGQARYEAEALTEGGPYGDIDLGVLVLRSGREVRLRCVESEGAPLPDLRVWVHGAGSRRVLTTDALGVLLVGLPRSAAEVRVEAFGYLTSRSTVPAEIGEHDVVMRRANLLRVEVVDAHARPWAGGKLRVVADRPPFGEENSFPPGFRVRNKGGVSAGRDGRGVHHCELPLDEAGVAEVPGLAPGLDVEVQVIDSLGLEVVAQRVGGLHESEERALTLRLPRDPCALDVRVLDGAGLGVDSAEVAIRAGARSVTGTTSPEGAVRFEALFASRVTLMAQHSSLQAHTLEDVDPCAGPVTLVLRSGRSLEVDVRDEAGRRVTAGWLSVLDLSGERSFDVTFGTSRFDGLPFEPLVLVWTLGSERREQSIDANQVSASLHVPILGEVVVSASAWQRVDRDRLRVRFERMEPDRGESEVLLHAPTSQVVWLLSGRYRLTSEVLSLQPGAPPQRRPFGVDRELHVQPDTRQTVELLP